ncbi:DUF3068 domain-containing protein [Nocardiopsis sp. EMB25]|uniref:DUF3068 domain-containing protein n=1 Tax=Nocardiopsis sp. EMB25 TaxID=2835867 RepID=UPI00228370DA|nr:DUF3068 domain-containing protein [Nocardiopsis sp. EMB25]MCY9785514.1 DUF3068 domain-containing protein [Nocardiopsis sp. EMB25]
MSALTKVGAGGSAGTDDRPIHRGTLLVAVGAFLLTLAALLPLYVHDRVALLPASAEFELRMVDEDAAYLDASTWSLRQGVELRRVVRVDAAPHGGDWSAWEMSVDVSTPERMIDHWSRRVIVDRVTGRAVNCCGEHVNGDRAVRQAGLVFHWPAGAPAEDVTHYDAEVRSAPRLEFQTEGQVAGVTARRYTQTVESTQVPGSARSVPAALFTPGAEGTVTAARWVEITRVYWVEPVSGLVVNAQETRSETLRPRGGGGEVGLLAAELTLSEGQVAALAEQARVRAFLLTVLDTWAPWILGPLGALAVLAGLVQAWRTRETALRRRRDMHEHVDWVDGLGKEPRTP